MRTELLIGFSKRSHDGDLDQSCVGGGVGEKPDWSGLKRE